MGEPLLMRVIQAASHVRHDPRCLERLDAAANLDEVAQVPAFDEVHHDEVRAVRRRDFVHRNHVGVLQRLAQLAFPDELARLRVAVAIAAAEDFDRVNLLGLAMARSEHARKRAGPHHVEDLVVAIEIPAALPLGQQLDLVVCQRPAADTQLEEVVRGDVAAAQLGPDFLNLAVGDQSQVDGPVGQSLGFGFGHAM